MAPKLSLYPKMVTPQSIGVPNLPERDRASYAASMSMDILSV